MSAFISTVTPEGACLLTDGAVRIGKVLVEDKCKVRVGNGVAVTGRGNSHVVDRVCEWFCEWAAELGAADAIERLQEFADQIGEDMDEAGDGYFEINVAAFLPGVGGVHRYFRASPVTMMPAGEVIPAFQIMVPGTVCYQPMRLETDNLGHYRPLPGESLAAWGRRGGLDFMKCMRQRPIDDGDGPVHGIGGHCDLTLVTAGGVKVEMIHDWRDVIGEPIRVA